VAQLPCGGVVADGSRLHVLFRGWFLSVFKAGKKKKRLENLVWEGTVKMSNQPLLVGYSRRDLLVHLQLTACVLDAA